MRKETITDLKVILNATEESIKEDFYSEEMTKRMKGDIKALKRIITKLEQIEETIRQLGL